MRCRKMGLVVQESVPGDRDTAFWDYNDDWRSTKYYLGIDNVSFCKNGR